MENIPSIKHLIIVPYPGLDVSKEKLNIKQINVLKWKDILNYDEIIWLNNYHSKVYEKLKDKLNVSEKKWLEKVTQSIS